jgi:ankyrin repeat protein
VVTELVNVGADVNLRGEGYTPLTAACEGGHVSVVVELVKVRADVNLQDRRGNTPLIAACEGGHVSVVVELVKVGADVNLQDRRGNTPLIAACEGGHVDVVVELVKVGADVNLQNDRGDTPLLAACYRGHVSVVVELVKVGADVNLQGNKLLSIKGNTPLIAAVRECPLSAVKCLVEHGADLVTQVVDSDVSAVYRALILNKADVVKYLVQEQNKISPGQYTGNVHLFNCLMDIRHAEVTTDSRDDVVVTDRSVWGMYKYGDVWWTIIERDCDVLRHLLCVGLDVNQSVQLYDGDRKSEEMAKITKSNARPLLLTLIDVMYVSDRAERVRVLLEAGADVSVRDRCREDKSVLDREGVSVLERTRQKVCQYRRFRRDQIAEYERILHVIKKRVRRYSV